MVDCRKGNANFLVNGKDVGMVPHFFVESTSVFLRDDDCVSGEPLKKCRQFFREAAVMIFQEAVVHRRNPEGIQVL